MSTLVRDRAATAFLAPLSVCPGKLERTLLVLGFIVLIAARLPDVALHGRVWAEEGIWFMRDAIVLPWPEALLKPVGGYLNLIANLAGIVAVRLVPLEQASRIGSVTGLLFQTLPAILIVSSGLAWLRTRIGLVAALLLIATVPLAEEVWLNSLHPQFHLTLCAALILGMNTAGGWTGRFHLLIILLAALCGPTAWLLLPLFAGRALIDRSGPRAAQAVTLAAGVLVQLVFFFGADQTSRAPFNLSAVVSAFLVKNLLIPGLDFRTAHAMSDALHGMAEARTLPLGIAVAELVFIVVGGVFLWLRCPKSLFWMFAAAVVIAIASYAVARGGTLELVSVGAGSRYAYVPQALFALVLLGLGQTGRGGVSWLVQGGVVWLLVVGISEFHDDSIYHLFSRGPSWTQEIAAWRRDPTHVVRIWPRSWEFDPNPVRR
jgi:hypothetical protein